MFIASIVGLISFLVGWLIPKKSKKEDMHQQAKEIMLAETLEDLCKLTNIEQKELIKNYYIKARELMEKGVRI